jgi:hypothetical protein
MEIDEKEIRNFLSSAKFTDAVIKFARENRLDVSEKILVDIYNDLLEGKFNLYKLNRELENRLKLNPDKAKELSLSLMIIYDDLVPEKLKVLAEKKIQQDLNQPAAPETLDGLIEDIKSRADLRISQNLSKRFETIVVNWFRGVRTDSGTKEALIKSTKIGGLNLSEEQAQNLVNVLKDKKGELDKQGFDISALVEEGGAQGKIEETEIDVKAKVKPASEAPVISRDVGINQLLKEKGIEYSELAKKEKIKRELGDTERVPEVSSEFAKEIVEEEEFLESKKEIPPLPASAPVPSPVAPKPISRAKIKIREQPILRKTVPEARPKLEDVKFTEPKLYGPLDELASLSITDFRRLSKDPKEAALKIMGKLDLLEDESLSKKAEGISALKSSPLYKLYAEIMNLAIKQGKSIEQIINENKKISLQEFKAIAELNQNLKY